MKAKRKHRDTTRLTARERAQEIADNVDWMRPSTQRLQDAIERALQAHARQALARERLRTKARR